MDAFKAAEIERMRLGGNKPWRDFFDAAELNAMAGIRYELSCLFLSCRVEGWGVRGGEGRGLGLGFEFGLGFGLRCDAMRRG